MGFSEPTAISDHESRLAPCLLFSRKLTFFVSSMTA
jgi:hypothetical protein